MIPAVSLAQGQSSKIAFRGEDEEDKKPAQKPDFNDDQGDQVDLNSEDKETADAFSEYQEKLREKSDKYINSDNRNKFFEYKIRKANPTITKELVNDEYVVKFNGIEYKKNVTILYSLKGVIEDDFEFESFDTIAVTDSPSNVVQTKDNNKDEYELRLKKGTYEFKCFQVIAQIRDGPITEYVSYTSINEIDKNKHRQKKDSDDDGGSGSSNTLYAIIGISVGLLVIVVVLVVVILIYNAKNRDLMDQVNKISFVKSGAKPKDDLNLLLDNQNELE